MFKVIPGSTMFVISLSQEIRRYDGTVVSIPVVDSLIEIELYGKLVKVYPKWLSLIAHFEIYLPNQSFKSLLNVYFVDNNITFIHPIISGKVPLFRKPVTVIHNSKTFRIIPSFSKYAVSNDGDVIEISTKETVKVSPVRKKTWRDYIVLS